MSSEDMYVHDLETDLERSENLVADLRADLAAARAEIERLREADLLRAISEGMRIYWQDAREQERTFRGWRESGYIGNGPSITKGDLADYVERSIRAALDATPAPGRETARPE